MKRDSPSGEDQSPSTSPPTRGRWATVWLTVLVNVVGLAVVMLVIELALGGWLGFREVDVLHVPRNVALTKDVTELVGAPAVIQYTRDEYGLRGEYGDPAQIDLLTLGGSTTDQRAISDDQTWQAVLARRLREDGRDVRIANAGVDGQSSYGHIVMFDRWAPTVPNLSARFVMVYVGVNDFYGQGTEHPDERSGLLAAIQDNSILYLAFRTLRSMRRVSTDYELLGHHYEDLSTRSWTSTALRDDHAQLMGQRSVEYEARIRTLVTRIRDFGAEPILVTQRFAVYKEVDSHLVGLDQTFTFDGKSINGVDAHAMISILNETLLRVCEEMDAICLDLAAEIDIEPTDFYDYVHPDLRGTETVADFLYERLRPVL